MDTKYLDIPSKTFIGGEYLVLSGGPGLLVSTAPKFKAKIQKIKSSTPFHPESPAGRFFMLNQSEISNFKIDFHDPYQKKGGFGASTAEFLSVYVTWKMSQSESLDAQVEWDISEVLDAYLNCFSKESRPSGADVVGQINGGITFYHRSQGKIKRLNWPFKDYGFFLIHTGNKIKTHEHLVQVSDVHALKLDGDVITQMAHSLESSDWDLFSDSFKKWKEILIYNRFQTFQTIEMCKVIESNTGIITCKGCGAMGADVIMALYEKSKLSPTDFAQKNKLDIVATDENISESGVTLK